MKLRLGVVLQDGRTDSELTVHEHLRMVGGYFGASEAQVSEALLGVGLDQQADRRIHKLSGGQRRKLEVATAFIGAPDLVFLDEPTTGLDVETRTAVWDRIRDARDAGAAIVLTTHYLEEVEQLADRIAILVEGRVIVDGSRSDVAAAGDLPLAEGLDKAYRAVVERARGRAS